AADGNFSVGSDPVSGAEGAPRVLASVACRHDAPIALAEQAIPCAMHRPAARRAAGLLLAGGSVHAAVFVNELHYDNAGGDSGERIEVVATDGESLAGYEVHLYSGGSSPGSATVYGSAAVPAGSLASCGGSVRIATVARSGLQNGPNDAIALVDASGQVVQFLG